MSTTMIYVIKRWGVKSVPIIAEYQNSHGSAPVVWDFMAQRYLGEEYHHRLKDMGELWNTSYREDIPMEYRRVMKVTCDRAILLNENALEAVSHIRKFVDEFPHPSNKVNHWAQIAEDIELFHSQNKYIAYGLRMTSMDENDFHGEPFMKRGKEHYHKINWKELGYFDAYASKITR